MAKVLDEILERFYVKLSESDTVNKATVKQFRTLFAPEKKLKADDIVAILKKAAHEGEP